MKKVNLPEEIKLTTENTPKLEWVEDVTDDFGYKETINTINYFQENGRERIKEHMMDLRVNELKKHFKKSKE